MSLIHHGSAVIVYSSYQYEDFDFINGNRKINENKIARIIKEIQSGNDMLMYYPIQVKEREMRMGIIDGQHRFIISRRLQLPVYYILVKEEKTIVDIAKVNSNVEKWTMQDYSQCYQKQGIKDYEKLNEFVGKYKVAVTTALTMLSKGTVLSGGNSEIVAIFQNGLFKVTHQKEAEEIMATRAKFHPLKYVADADRAFLHAVNGIKICGKVSIDELAATVKKYPEMLTVQSNYKNYIYKLEEIFNIGKHNRRIIYEAPKKTRIKKMEPEKLKKAAKPKPEKKKKELPRKYETPKDVKKVQVRIVKRGQPKYKTIAVENSDYQKVRIDEKTEIMVKKGADIGAEVEKYKNNLKKKEKLTKQHG